MEAGVTEYVQYRPVRPACGRQALVRSFAPWWLSVLLLLAGGTASAAVQNLQHNPFALPHIAAAVRSVEPLALTLRAAPKQLTVGKPVRFTTSFNRDVSKYDIRYKLFLNDIARAEWSNNSSYTHRFDTPGTYQAHVNAYWVQTTGTASSLTLVATSNPESVTVAPGQLSVRIRPPAMPVRQGDIAVFRLEVTPDVPVSYYWQGPNLQTSQTPQFRVDTRDLSGGRHPILVKVKNNRGQVAEDEVDLVVEAVYQKPTASIEPQTLIRSRGEVVEFQAEHTVDDRLTVNSRRWRGPAGVKINTDRYVVNTRDLAQERYAIVYEVYDSQGQRARARAELKVIPAPPLRVEIVPSQPEVLPGEQVRFEAVVQDPGNRRYAYRWIGPGDRESTGKRLTVTANAALLGRHTITLLVEDDLGRSAKAEARLHVNAPVLSLRRESDSTIQAGDTVLLRGVVTPAVPVENLRLHDGTGGAGRSMTLNEPYAIRFDTAGEYWVYLTGQMADLRLESPSQLIRVDRAPTFWLLWAGAGLAALGGLGWMIRRLISKPRVPHPTGISVDVNPNFSQWQGGFEHTADTDHEIRLALVVDLGEQSWDEEPGGTTQEQG